MITQIFKIRLHRLKFKLIIILVSGFWFMVSTAFTMDVDLWNLAQPPQSNILWKDRQLKINGINARGSHLACELKAKEVIDFYQDILSKSGWQLKDYFKETNIIVFTKDNTFMYVGVQDNGEGIPCDVYIVKSPQTLALCRMLASYFKERAVEDAPGEDLSDIPRYPASKRMISIFAPEDGATLLYEAGAQPQEIVSFYEKQLKLSGWQPEQVLSPSFLKAIDPKTQREDVAFSLFEKGDDNLLIIIYGLPQDSGKGRSIITITRNMWDEFASYPIELKEE